MKKLNVAKIWKIKNLHMLTMLSEIVYKIKMLIFKNLCRIRYTWKQK